MKLDCPKKLLPSRLIVSLPNCLLRPSSCKVGAKWRCYRTNKKDKCQERESRRAKCERRGVSTLSS